MKIMPNNFNPNLSDTSDFTEVFIDSLQTFDGSKHPVKGVPGFLVVTKHGYWSWFGTIQEALEMAGTEHAVYQAVDCGTYFQQFAVPHTQQNP